MENSSEVLLRLSQAVRERRVEEVDARVQGVTYRLHLIFMRRLDHQNRVVAAAKADLGDS